MISEREFVLQPSQAAWLLEALDAELSRRIVGKPHRQIIWFLRSRSWEIGRPCAFVKYRRGFRADTGLHESEVSRSLDELIATRVVIELPESFYWINPQFSDWRLERLWQTEGWEEHHRPKDLPFDLGELPGDLRQMVLMQHESFLRILTPAHAAAVRGAGSQVGRSVPEVSRLSDAEAVKHGAAMARLTESPVNEPCRPNAEIASPRSSISCAPHIETRSVEVQAGYNSEPAFSMSENVLGKIPSTLDGETELGKITSTPGAGSAPELGNFPRSLRTANENGPPAVLGKVTSTPGTAAKPGAASFPPSHSPLLNRVSDEPGTRVPAASLIGLKAKPGPARRTRAEEERLMDLLRGFIPKDVEDMGGFWRANVVRNLPASVIEEAIGEGMDMVRTQRPFNTSRARWLNWYIARLAGLKNLQGLPPGPAPRA